MSFVGFAVVVGAALLLFYSTSKRQDPQAQAIAMEGLASRLRTARRRARRALLECATESGEIPVGGAQESGGSGVGSIGGAGAGTGTGATRVLRYWATGPAEAPLYILLAAEDGETAAVWGSVHARLVKELAGAAGAATGGGVRVVSFHRASLSTSPSTPRPLMPTSSVDPVSLRVRDLEALVDGLRRPPPSSSSWLGGSSSSPLSPPPRVVVVHQGQGAWAGLAYAGLHASTTAAAVSVAPLLMHRGRQLAWVDAIVGASRVRREDDPGVLARLLEAPPVSLSEEQMRAVDASVPKRLDTLNFYSKLGLPKEEAAAKKRFAEDFRRFRASQTVFSGTEAEVVAGCGAAVSAAGAGAGAGPGTQSGTPVVRTLTYAPDALPSFLHEEARSAVEIFFLAAANTVGAFLGSSSGGSGGGGDSNGARLGAGARGAAHTSLTAEVSNILAATTAKPAAAGGGEAAGGDSTIPGLLATDGASSSLASSLSSWLAVMPALSLTPETLDEAKLHLALRRIPAFLGLVKPPAIEQLRAYTLLEGELSKFSPKFGVTLVHASCEEEGERGEGSAAANKRGQAAWDDVFGVVNIPLQCPGAVAAEVLDALALGGPGGSKVGASAAFGHRRG